MKWMQNGKNECQPSRNEQSPPFMATTRPTFPFTRKHFAGLLRRKYNSCAVYYLVC